jgi:hypothetical protein
MKVNLLSGGSARRCNTTNTKVHLWMRSWITSILTTCFPKIHFSFTIPYFRPFMWPFCNTFSPQNSICIPRPPILLSHNSECYRTYRKVVELINVHCTFSIPYVPVRMSYMFQMNSSVPIRNVYNLEPTLTHSWNRALLEKLPIVQLLENFPAFYGTRRFITAFT